MPPSTPQELPGHSPSILISILNRTVTDAVLERLAAEGFGDIRPSHDAVFEMIDPDGSRVSEMAERARVTKQSMGEQVAYLEARGYLERRPDPRDGRAKLVVLTPKGHAAVTQAIGAVTDLEAQWADALGERRARAFSRALTDLSVAFGRAHIRAPAAAEPG